MYNITYNNSFAYVWGLRLQIVDDPYIWVNAGNNSSLFLCLLIIEVRKTHERGNSAHHDVRSNLVVLLALISGCELWRLECAGCGIWPYCDYQTHLNCSFCHKYLIDIPIFIDQMQWCTNCKESSFMTHNFANDKWISDTFSSLHLLVDAMRCKHFIDCEIIKLCYAGTM